MRWRGEAHLQQDTGEKKHGGPCLVEACVRGDGGRTVSVTGGTTDLSVTLGPDLGRSGRNECDVCNRVNRALVVQDGGAAGTTGKHIVKR